ncbi:esterase/lipase family protein [Burkholderiaceae bacterium UC74_6]
MNGRLQRWRLLARCGLALLALWIWGWIPALLIVLSSECIVLAALLLRQAGHPQPLPDLIAAAWRECWQSELVFGYWQPFAEHREPDHLPQGATGHAGVLLLHGFHCNRGLWTDWLRWFRKQDVACIALSLEPADGSIDAYAAPIEEAVQRLTTLTGAPPLILAHSMGGLAARAWWRANGQPGRVKAFVTLGTPHAGTPMAHFAAAINAREMRPGSEWLHALAEAELGRPLPPLHCLSSSNDQIVFPTSTTQLAGAAQLLELPATGHLGLVFHPEVRALVARLLGKTAEDQAPAVNTPRRI